MDQKEAVRRADYARNMQRSIQWQLDHNAELYARAQADAAATGKGVRATLFESGNVKLEVVDDVPSGQLIWMPDIAAGDVR